MNGILYICRIAQIFSGGVCHDSVAALVDIFDFVLLRAVGISLHGASCPADVSSESFYNEKQHMSMFCLCGVCKK